MFVDSENGLDSSQCGNSKEEACKSLTEALQQLPTTFQPVHKNIFEVNIAPGVYIGEMNMNLDLSPFKSSILVFQGSASDETVIQANETTGNMFKISGNQSVRFFDLTISGCRDR